MRYPRQAKILELISANDIETQDELAKLLVQNGFKVTQATVSRDIKELKLIKVLGPDGKYKYATGQTADPLSSERYMNLIRDMMLSAASAENMVVVKTMSGCANACAEAIDSLELEGVVGTIAGDNTIFLAAVSKEKAGKLVRFFNEQVKSR
ncbi:MAG: arginine repressor [Firmicutes bacterium]|nr:arginine repressor [Bacillota bacterium]MBR6503617.1 arginine repressor [Bacillota bacterium]